MRDIARSGLLGTAGSLARILPKLSVCRPRVHFIYCHSALPSAEGNLRQLLNFLSKHTRLESYSQAVQQCREGTPEVPVISLSVDDAFRSCMRIADIAEEFGLSVCFFVPTDLVGARTRAEVANFFRSSEHIEDGALSWEQIQDLRSRGHEIGSHTVSHLSLIHI